MRDTTWVNEQDNVESYMQKQLLKMTSLTLLYITLYTKMVACITYEGLQPIILFRDTAYSLLVKQH